MSLQAPQLPSPATRPASKEPQRTGASYRRRLLTAAVFLLSVVGVFGSLLYLRKAGVMRRVDFLVYDALIRYRNARPDYPVNPPIVVVRMTEPDIQELGTYPISDLRLAELLEKIIAAEPAAVGIDIFRDLPTPHVFLDKEGKIITEGVPDAPTQDARLAKVLQDNPNIVFIMSVRPEGVTINAPRALRGEDYFSQRGFYNHTDDHDGIVRRAFISQKAAGADYVGFALWLALNYLDTQDIRPRERTPGSDEPLTFDRAKLDPITPRYGDYVGGIDARGEQFLLDYRGPAEFPNVRLMDVLNGRVPPETLKGKVIFIAVNAESIKDITPTPLNAVSWGVDIHAHTVDQIIRAATLGHTPTLPISDSAETLWILLWTVLGALAGLFARRPMNFSFTALGGLLLLALVVIYAFMHGVWLPSVEPALGWFIAAGIVAPSVSQQERAERAMLMQIFEQFQSKDVAEMLWKQRDVLLEGGRVKPQGIEATVVFTDLAGFSTVSEKMEPATLMDWLSDYLATMASCVEAHGGMVNKYIGDAVMAVFGAPIPSTTPEEIRKDAIDAVSTALDMRKKLAEANRRWAAQGLPQVQMRVGIMSGHLVAGVLASGRREYTVIGDVVNTAARLESYEKELMDADIASDGCRILVGGPTYELVKGQFKTRFIALDEVKGKTQKVEIYGVIHRLPAAANAPSPE